MSLAEKFYRTLTDVLVDIGDIEAGVSLLQIDKAISMRFGISESTARNWRRGTNTTVSATVASTIINICEQIAPDYVADLEFIGRLSEGMQGIKIAANSLVDELCDQVYSENSTWSIYSGPLRLAVDPKLDPAHQYELMNRASLIMERILEMKIDHTDVPSIGELIRYSTHGWWSKGFLRIREASLSSQEVGIFHSPVGAIETALYISDGCGGACMSLGNFRKAMAYHEQAIQYLETIQPIEPSTSLVDFHDSLVMIKSLQVITACFEDHHYYESLLTDFIRDFATVSVDSEWIDSIRHEALGFIELARKVDFAKAGYHFGTACERHDTWMAKFGIPFSVKSTQSLYGYALLMTDGLTDRARAIISQGLIKTIDYGSIGDQIKARLCQSLLHNWENEFGMAALNRQKAEALAHQYHMDKWYAVLTKLIIPEN